MTALADALSYVERGWFVLPLRCDRPEVRKDPDGLLVPHGFLEASADLEQIGRWFGLEPERGMGLACKQSGIVALDIDPDRGGDDQLHDLQCELGGLPDSPRSLSGGGGQHLLFRHPDVPAVKARLTPGVEIKSAGYIVLPRSLHLSGRRYEWEIPPEELPLATLPDQWIAVMTREHKVYAPGARDGARDWLESIPPIRYARDLARVEPDRRGFIRCIAPDHALITGRPDNTPSLKLYDTAVEGWCCHGCKRGGGIFQFAALALGIADTPLRGTTFLVVQGAVERKYAEILGVEI